MASALAPANIKQVGLNYRMTAHRWTYKTEKEPDPNCKKAGCCGRGWVGIHTTTRQPMPCDCVGRFDLIHEPGGGGSEDGPPKH